MQNGSVRCRECERTARKRHDLKVSVSLINPDGLAACESEDDLLG